MQHAQVIKVLVVDYHNIVCSGIAEVLRNYQDFHVVGHTDSSEVALKLCERFQPDVVTLDIDLPGLVHGIDLIHQIHSDLPRIRLVVLTNNADASTVHSALQAGVTGYLLKNISVEELAHAIRSAYQGQSTLSPEITQVLISALTAPVHDLDELTHREHQVLTLISKGRTNQEIAEDLSISLSTVQFHVRNILGKLGVHNRIEAATLAIRQEFNHHSTWFMPSWPHTHS